MCMLSHMLSFLLLGSVALAAPATDASARLMRSDQDHSQVHVVMNHAAGMDKQTRELPIVARSLAGDQPKHAEHHLSKPHTDVPIHIKISNPQFHGHMEQYLQHPDSQEQPAAPLSANIDKTQVGHASLLQNEPLVVDEELLKAPSPLAEAFSRRFGLHASAEAPKSVIADVGMTVPTLRFAHTPMAPDFGQPAAAAPPAHEPAAREPAELDAIRKKTEPAAVAATEASHSIKAAPGGIRFSDGSFQADDAPSPSPAPSPTPLA